MNLFSRTALTACVASIAASSAAAQFTSIVIPATQDNTLYESATGANSNGAGMSGYTGGNSGGSKRRYLVQFDVAGVVPPAADILFAELRVYCINVPGGATNDTYETHRMLAAWGEGTSSGSGGGAPSTPGDATWIHTFFPGSNWATPGGDFDPVGSAGADINSFGFFTLSSVELRDEVEGFRDNPASNFGWMIKANSEGIKTARGIASRENTTANLPPTLRVVYSFPDTVTFCDPANNNSTGSPAVLSGSFGTGFGSDLHLDVSGGPVPLADGSPMLGFILVGNMPTAGVAVSDGRFCLIGSGGSFGRYNVAGTDRNSVGVFDAAGNLQNLVGTGGPSGSGFNVPSDIELAGSPLTTIMAGDTYHFQCWYRDTAAGSGHTNFSNALTVVF
ncbi:MAG: DNRLRE domain-containing protein [Planctomycetes bacterium]|nr:DNRLRE domain-containing protein [Planctomycetota bacterium]